MLPPNVPGYPLRKDSAWGGATPTQPSMRLSGPCPIQRMLNCNLPRQPRFIRGGGNMKRAFGLLAVAMLTGVTYGQMRDNRDTQLSCDANRRNGAGSCEIQETTLGPSGSLQIEPGRNGRIIVKGWSQNSVRVRALIETWAPSDAAARNLTSQVHVDTGAGFIRATGPENSGFQATGDEGWAVSFEVFAPWSTDLKLESHNGSIAVSDIRGRITFQTHNGSIHLARIAG